MNKLKNSFIRLCPDISEVFVPSAPTEFDYYFLPLCSIEMSILNRQWQDTLHIVYFNSEVFSDFDAKCSTALGQNHARLDFQVQTNGLYTLKTNLNFTNVDSFWLRLHERARTTYAQTKTQFRSLNYPLSKMSQFLDFDATKSLIRPNERPKNAYGNPMQFVCRLYSGLFCQDHCEKDLHLYYCPETRQVTQISVLD